MTSCVAIGVEILEHDPLFVVGEPTSVARLVGENLVGEESHDERRDSLEQK
jgi:hypothetical protein